MLNILMNIGLSICASSIWAIVGLILYRKEKISRVNLAFFLLHAGMDRLKDSVSEVRELVENPKLLSYERIRRVERSLERHVQAIDYEWIVSNLPYKNEELIWMYDVSYVLNNSSEMVNELYDLAFAVRDGDEESIETSLESLNEVCEDILKAIEGEIKLIPEKYKMLQ